jgi:hypothetical protein
MASMFLATLTLRITMDIRTVLRLASATPNIVAATILKGRTTFRKQVSATLEKFIVPVSPTDMLRVSDLEQGEN